MEWRPDAGGPLWPQSFSSGAVNIGGLPFFEWAERAFCKRCGTHLYYKLLATGEYFVPAGVFDSGDFQLATQIYIDKKPGYYSFANQTPTAH